MKKSAKVAIAGAVLLLGSLMFGVGGTVIGMVRSFSSVAESSNGSAQELSEGIANSLICTVIGIPLAFIGLCLLVGGSIACIAGRGKTTTEDGPA